MRQRQKAWQPLHRQWLRSRLASLSDPVLRQYIMSLRVNSEMIG
jgi:hypothetical protein